MGEHEKVVEFALGEILSTLVQIREFIRPLRVTADNPNPGRVEEEQVEAAKPPALDMKRATKYEA